MKIQSLVLIIILLLGVSCEKSERQKIEEEKENIRIQTEARKEIFNEESNRIKNSEIELLIQRFNIAKESYLNEPTRENLALLEVIANRITNSDMGFILLENEEIGKRFEVEFISDNESVLKGLAYIKAKEDNGIGISNYSFNGNKLIGHIIKN